MLIASPFLELMRLGPRKAGLGDSWGGIPVRLGFLGIRCVARSDVTSWKDSWAIRAADLGAEGAFLRVLFIFLGHFGRYRAFLGPNTGSRGITALFTPQWPVRNKNGLGFRVFGVRVSICH